MINVFTGRCDEPKFGECSYCGGNLTTDHSCPQREQVEAAVESMLAEQPTKLARMIKLWVAANDIEQAQLASEWKAPPATVSRFLNGKNMPDGRTTARIIAWLLEP